MVVLPLVKQPRAHKTIDFTKNGFTKTEALFDIIFDAVGRSAKSVCRHLLKTGGKNISVVCSPKSNPADLLVLKDLIVAGILIRVIDRKYTLEQIREVHIYVESFRKKG